VLEALLFGLKGRRHGKDRLPVLDGDHAARGEAAAVAAAVDLVKDGGLGIARPEEIGVQRMAGAALDRALRRHQRLAQHLAAIDALPAVLGRHAAEDVGLDGFEIEDFEEHRERKLGAVGGERRRRRHAFVHESRASLRLSRRASRAANRPISRSI
jgi:hypothetical protein